MDNGTLEGLMVTLLLAATTVAAGEPSPAHSLSPLQSAVASNQLAPMALPPCQASPGCISTAATEAGQRVPAFLLAMPAAEAWPRLRSAVAGLPRTVIVDDRDGYLRAEASSRIFRFVDDLELLLDTANNAVVVRAAARTGYGDAEANRERVETLRQQLQQAGVIAGP